MTILTLDSITKVEGQERIKDFSLCVPLGAQIGIRMNSQESRLLFRLIIGQIIPSTGKIEKSNGLILSKYIEDGLYPKLTVKQYLNMFGKISEKSKKFSLYEEAIAAFSLGDVLHEKIKNLSFDQKQRLHILRMVLLNPQVLLIESPLRDLSDSGIELYIKGMAFVGKQKIGVIFTAAYHEELLLLAEEVYHYSPYSGLEKLEIESEETNEDKITTELVKPAVNIFKVACKLEDKTVFFAPNEIDFIESLNGSCVLHIGEETFSANATMNDLEGKLSSFGFFRCHRSYLVNLQRVSELISYSRNSYTLILKGSAYGKIPLSRSRLEEMRQLIDF